jgi:maltose O-acetyltransferase
MVRQPLRTAQGIAPREPRASAVPPRPDPPSGMVNQVKAFGRRAVLASLDEISGFDIRRVVGRATSYALPQFSFNRTRTLLLRATGVRIGAHSLVMGVVEFTGPGNVRELFSIGEGTILSCPLRVDLGATVRIGDRVQLGHDVALLTISHEIGPSEDRCGSRVAAPITISDGAWIASRVTILPGVSIGQGAVVAAGAVVNRDVAPNTLVAGVPAKLVRHLETALQAV